MYNKIYNTISITEFQQYPHDKHFCVHKNASGRSVCVCVCCNLIWIFNDFSYVPLFTFVYHRKFNRISNVIGAFTRSTVSFSYFSQGKKEFVVFFLISVYNNCTCIKMGPRRLNIKFRIWMSGIFLSSMLFFFDRFCVVQLECDLTRMLHPYLILKTCAYTFTDIAEYNSPIVTNTRFQRLALCVRKRAVIHTDQKRASVREKE